MNKIKKRGIAIIIATIIVLFVLNNILAQSTDINDYLKDQTGLQSFIDSSGTDKNNIWEESKKSEGSLLREALAEEAIKQIYKDKLKNDLAAGAEKMLIQTMGNLLYKEMEKRGVPAQLGVKIESISQLKEVASKAGINLDVSLATEIENVEGFGSKDLSWSKTGKNIIGNGKTFLNLDKLPYKVNSIKYDESKKVFVLKTKDGGELVLGEGATDENGNVIMLSSLTENSLLKKVMVPFKDLKDPIGLENFIITGDKGQVVLGKDGFEIKGEGIKIRFGDFTFARKIGESSRSIVLRPVGTISSEDELIIRGIEFERKNYVKVSSTDYDFTLNFETNPHNVASGIREKNFLNMHGENFAVGGKGNIEVLRDLNELRGFDCKDFNVKIGDIDLSFKEKGIYKDNKGSFKNAFAIDNVYAVANEKSLEEPFKIAKSGDRYTFEAANFIAGKLTGLSKLGISYDVSLVVDKKDLEKVKGKVKGAWFFPESALVESLKDSSYSYNLDMYVPLEGASITTDNKIKNEVVIPQLREMLSKGLLSNLVNTGINSDYELVNQFGNRELKPETQKIVESLAEKFIGQIETSSISGGKYSFKINNNPGSSPTLSVLMPGNRESTISLNNQEQMLLKDILDVSLIVPDRGEIAYTIYSPIGSGKMQIPAWPPNHLKELWYTYLGQESSSASLFDKRAIKKVVNKYTNSK